MRIVSAVSLCICYCLFEFMAWKCYSRLVCPGQVFLEGSSRRGESGMLASSIHLLQQRSSPKLCRIWDNFSMLEEFSIVFWLQLDVSENSGTPQIIHFNRVFHYKPSILGYPYFWKHPTGCASYFLHPWATWGSAGATEISFDLTYDRVLQADIEKVWPNINVTCHTHLAEQVKKCWKSGMFFKHFFWSSLFLHHWWF